MSICNPLRVLKLSGYCRVQIGNVAEFSLQSDNELELEAFNFAEGTEVSVTEELRGRNTWIIEDNCWILK